MLKRHNASEPALHINVIDVNNEYKFLKKIGKGSYGEVWLVLPTRTSSQKSRTKQYVLKRLDLRQSLNTTSQNDIESAEREAQILSTLKHPNIVAYAESFRSSDGFLNIVMAYCEGGDLYTKLKEKKSKQESLTENQIIEWFIQICMALQYIHEKNILHRDLKTQNIFLTKNEIVKVGDLGIARVLESGNDLATTIIGTPYYMSPEIFSQKPYGQKSDIWSLGCCVYEMITLKHVFNAKDVNALVSKIIREEFPQLSNEYSKQLRDILTSMLKKNPEDRPTAKAILQNAYIKQHILRLLEKAQTKYQNQVHSKSRVSSPSRPTSASNASPPRSRLSIQNNTPILPSYSVSPSSHSRPPSSYNNNRSIPVAQPIQSNEPKVSESRIRRRRNQACRSSPLPINNQQKDLEFLSNVQQNDTLQRFKRNQQMTNHVKQYQQRSSSDEQDVSPVRSENVKMSSPIIIQKQTRTNSMESNINSSKPPSHSQVAKSYDSNQGSKSSARQRRRENKVQSSSTEYSTPNGSPIQTAINNESLASISQVNLIAEIEKKKEREEDMNDFVCMLTATLQLPPSNIRSSNESTESERTLIDDESSQNRLWSAGERTIATPLLETNRLRQRCQLIRENCLREISPDRLQRVLKIAENISEVSVMQEMIDELGEGLYHKYSEQIYSLKFYEDNLFIHS